ncbi:MAG: helix-turn-helix domain-containing protein [Rhodothermales bacterium]
MDMLIKLIEEQHNYLLAAMQVARDPLTAILELPADLEASVLDADAMRIKPHIYYEKTRALQRLFDLSLRRLQVGRLLLGHKKDQVDIVANMQNVKHALLKHAKHKEISVSSTAAAGSPWLETDPQKLQFVINQLIVKAIEETTKGGKVLIKIDYPEQGDYQFVTFGVKYTARHTKPMEREAAPDQFRRIESDLQKPTFLWYDMLLVERMVASMGGKLTETIEEGFSTEYVVRFSRTFDPSVCLNLPEIVVSDFLSGKDEEPASVDLGTSGSDGRQSHSEDDTEPVPKEDKKKSIILLVEDNDDIRYYLKTCLEPHYHVEEAENALKGLEKAAEIVPDMIISDVMMPYMDGHTFCRQIKEDEKLNHIPVILSTALAEAKYHVEGMEAEADAYLIKPYESKVLLANVRSLLANRRRLRDFYSDKIYIEPIGVSVPSVDAEFIESAQLVVEKYMSDETFNSIAFAEALFMGERQLQRKFKSLTGMTPMKYVRILRLKRAAHLLEHRRDSIAQTAYKVGFASSRQFARAFRAFYKKTPSEFRDAARKVDAN